MNIWLKTHSGLLVITAIYLLTFLLMLPLKNQAFDDDFAYIRTTERLVKTGQLKLSDWTATSLIFQVYWGALFLGFSLLFSLFIILFISRFYWQEYILQFFPFVLIGLAYFWRKTEINYALATIVVFSMLLFSLQTTRYRYQSEGTMWELGNKLIENGYETYRKGVYWLRPSPKGEIYKLTLVPYNRQVALERENNIVAESEPFWVFWDRHKIIAIKSINK